MKDPEQPKRKERKKMTKKEILARDITRPVDSMELDGEKLPLAFDLNCFRVAEDVYELHYDRSLNFGQIVTQLADGKIGAVMAVLYGALVSAGNEIKWSEFSKKFRLIDIPGVKEMVMERVTQSLPETDGTAGNPPTKAAE